MMGGKSGCTRALAASAVLAAVATTGSLNALAVSIPTSAAPPNTPAHLAAPELRKGARDAMPTVTWPAVVRQAMSYVGARSHMALEAPSVLPGMASPKSLATLSAQVQATSESYNVILYSCQQAYPVNSPEICGYEAASYASFSGQQVPNGTSPSAAFSASLAKSYTWPPPAGFHKYRTVMLGPGVVATLYVQSGGGPSRSYCEAACCRPCCTCLLRYR